MEANPTEPSTSVKPVGQKPMRDDEELSSQSELSKFPAHHVYRVDHSCVFILISQCIRDQRVLLSETTRTNAVITPHHLIVVFELLLSM